MSAGRSEIDNRLLPGKKPSRDEIKIALVSFEIRSNNGCVRGPRLRRLRCLCEPYSNPGNTPGDRLAAQKAPWWAGHILSKSQVFPESEPHGNRNPLPGRSFWPDDKAYSVSVSKNRVLEKTPDLQR
jgi:hypothetical protein